MELTHALALSANQFYMQEKVPTCMHSVRLEPSKLVLIGTRPIKNLPSHRARRLLHLIDTGSEGQCYSITGVMPQPVVLRVSNTGSEGQYNNKGVIPQPMVLRGCLTSLFTMRLSVFYEQVGHDLAVALSLSIIVSSRSGIYPGCLLFSACCFYLYDICVVVIGMYTNRIVVNPWYRVRVVE